MYLLRTLSGWSTSYSDYVENQAGHTMETPESDPACYIPVLYIVAMDSSVNVGLAKYGDHRW